MRMPVLTRFMRLALALGLGLAAPVAALAAWTGLSPGLEAMSLPGARPTLLALPGSGSNLAASGAAPRVLVVADESPKGLRFADPDSAIELGRLSLSGKPIALAVDSAGSRAYVLTGGEDDDDEGGRWLRVVEIGARRLLASFKLGGDPKALLLREADGAVVEVLVAQKGPDRLIGVNPATGATLRSVTLDRDPATLAWALNGTRILAGAKHGKLYALDASTLALVSTAAIGDEVKHVSWWEAGSLAVVVHKKQDGVSLVDVASGQVSAFVPLDGDPERSVVDAATDRAYVTTHDDFSVNRVNLAARTLEGRYALPQKASGAVFDALTAKLLISQRGDRRLLRLDPAQAPLISVLSLNKRLRDIAVNHVTHEAVAVADKADELTRIKLADRSTATVNLPSRPRFVAVDTALNLAVVGMKNKQIRFVDTAQTPPVLLPGSVALPDEPEALAVDSTRNLAVALTDSKRKIHFVSNASKTLLSAIVLNEDTEALALHAGRGLAYVLTDKKKLLLVNLDTRSLAQTIALPFRGNAIAVDEGRDRAVITTDQGDKAYVLDLSTINSGTASLAEASFLHVHVLPKEPGAVAIQTDSGLAVIAAKESDALSSIDLDTGALAAAFVTLEKPFALAITSRYNQALVLGAEKDEVSFVQLPNPVPVLETLTPNEAAAGSAALTVTLTGKRFIDSSIVYFGTNALASRWIGHTRLEADVPAKLLASAASDQVRVRTPAPAGGDSNALGFTVLAPPVLSAIDPNTALADGQPKVLSLSGQNFRSGARVLFGAAMLPAAFNGATSLTVTIPGALAQSPGTVQVAVLNPSGQLSNSLAFRLIPPLAITSFTPAAGPVGTAVAISGIGFDPAAANNQVRFNGELAVIVSGAAGTLNVIVPTRATTGPITLANSRGTATSATPFTVQEREAFDITLAPVAIQVPRGGNGATRVRLVSTGLNPYPNAALVAVSGLPAGVSSVLERPTVYLGGDAIVTFLAQGTAAPGVYPVSITATGQTGLTTTARSKTLNLEVLAAGATTVTGRVLHADDDAPFVGARVRLGTTHVFTDQTGTYRFISPPVLGDQVLLIDGNTANTPTAEFPSGIPMPVMIVAGQDSKALTTFIGRVDPTKFTSIVPGQAATVTSPDIPNFSLNIPQGVTIFGLDGQPVNKINVRTVPVDRLPIRPIPEGQTSRFVYLFYFFREGGGNPTQPVPVTLPNDADAAPGEQIEMWYYDESPTPDPNSNQWRLMGLGTVSADGKSIVSNPGVGIPKFCCGAVRNNRPPPPDDTGGTGGDGNPPPPAPPCRDPAPPPPTTTNPVDLASGNALIFQARPFGISKLMSVNPNCQYRSTDSRVGLFGRGMSFSYDWFAVPQGSQVVRVTNPAGVHFILTREVDGVFRSRSGRSASVEMEVTPSASGRTLRFADGTQYDFDTSGRLTAMQDLAGNRTTFQLNAQGFPQSMTDAAGKLYQFQLTGAAPTTKIARITDPAGRFVQFDYDAGHRLTRYTDQGGGVTQLEYDASNRISRMTDPRLAVKAIEYDTAGRAVREVLPGGAEERYAYSTVGNTVAETRHTDANGNTTTYRFNGLGYMTRQSDALGRVRQYALDAVNNLMKRLTDPAGRVTQYTHNARGDVVRVIDADGRQTLIDYDLRFRKPVRIENALGHVTTMEYNSQGNVIRVTNAESETTTFSYTAKGQLETVTDPLNRVTRFTYDANGNLLEATNAANETSTRLYDSANRLIELVDPVNRSTVFTYDDLDRVTQVRDGAFNLTKYSYDANDNLVSATDPNNNPVERNVYDLRNRLIRKTDAKNRDTVYVYDGVGNLIRMTDRKGRVTTYAYDALNRVTQVSDPDRTSSYGYDLAGDLTRISDSQSGDLLMAYDRLDRLLEIVTPQGTVSYSYDAIGRRTSRTLSGGDVTAYTYDKANRVKTVALRGRTASYSYDAAGRLTGKVLPNGVKVTYSYDAADRVTSIAYKKTDNTPIETVGYTYDQAGQRTVKGTGSASLPETAFSATYDEANRLAQITLGGEAFTLTYDDNGNLASKSGPTSGATAYTWTARNQLAQIAAPAVSASFKYDAMGRRIEKTVNGTTTGFLYDGAQAIAELRGNALDTVYHTGLEIDEVLARYAPSGNRTLLTDALMSVIAQAKDDQSVQNFYAYSPYGESVSLGPDEGNPLQYTGRENDGTGLYYYRARYYDPVLKRFVSEDPIGIAGGLNLAAYVGGNPVNRTDPSGLQYSRDREGREDSSRERQDRSAGGGQSGTQGSSSGQGAQKTVAQCIAEELPACNYAPLVCVGCILAGSPGGAAGCVIGCACVTYYVCYDRVIDSCKYRYGP